MGRILIAGGTGLIGQHLSSLLQEKGFEVIHLSRKSQPNARFKTYEWDLTQGYIEAEALENIDYVINLAGAGVADKRWTERRKETLIKSRIHGASIFAKYIIEGEFSPKAYISASAIGLYGNNGNEILNEENKKGNGFLAECTFEWEKAIRLLAKTNVRTVGLRIGIVLSPKGGALEKMLMPFKFGIGNWFGNGEQIYSWIHMNDVCKMFILAIEKQEMSGFYNAVAPNPISNKTLAHAIKKARGKACLMLPVPAIFLRIPLGEMADVVLNGSHVSSAKIEEAGFEFEFPEIDGALDDLLD